MMDLKKSYLKRYKDHMFSNLELKYLEAEIRLDQKDLLRLMEEINESTS